MNDIVVNSKGELIFNGKLYHCALGKGGVKKNKVEGDGATPIGCFEIRKVFYRPDRLKAPQTVLVTQALTKQDGWSDDADLPEYNTFVKLLYKGSYEELWRDDHVYDIIVILGYNDEPVVPGTGSAVFMHLARENYTPTAGCIALHKDDLLEILSQLEPATKVCVSQ